MEIDRNNLKLMASGKYLDVNKSYNQEQHNQYIEGAMFAFDLMTQIERNKLKQIKDDKQDEDKSR